jgi:hypothetical protein
MGICEGFFNLLPMNYIQAVKRAAELKDQIKALPADQQDGMLLKELKELLGYVESIDRDTPIYNRNCLNGGYYKTLKK